MEIIRLDVGQHAPVDTDCIIIEETASGAFKLTASALCDHTDGDAPDSVSLVGDLSFDSYDAAEEAGLVWADAQGVDRVYISYGPLGTPLQLREADKPL